MASSDQHVSTPEDQKKYFNNYFQTEINYNASEVDAVIGYFLKRGFEKLSAINTASVILQQAEVDDVPVFELLDTLSGTTDVQLNNIIAQILNLNRQKTSLLGYRSKATEELFDQRNIIV
jgi:succinate dehydrogenase flavin-adding protein (antitoxin of CptAB toxin-antitoxin module)|tara:strand:- start:229 stop:588 length:360 start_codon:yes stop_codon:yes gene_type:complete